MSYTKSKQLPPPVIDYLANLGERIVASRKIQRLRQGDLCAMSGVSRSTLVEIEKGSPFVSMGGYLSVLWALGLMSDAQLGWLSESDQRVVASELPQRVRHG